MDDLGCPRCKTTKYRNPSLKLMVNVCGHTLCESCVELLFVRGAGNCHECDTPLRKSNFRVQLFEDPAVDKEVEIRKKVLKIYNKREEDFPTLDEYNDFLEEIEEIVFNLTNNVDLENTKKKMELYQKDNKEVIQKNKLKLTREQEELEEALEVERQESEQRRLFIQKEEQLQQMMKRKNKQALLDDLESSDLPASLLLAQHKDRSTQLEMQLEKPKPVKPVTFSTGIKMGQHISLAPIQKLEETLYEYQPLQVETYGPQVPELEMLGRLGLDGNNKYAGDEKRVKPAERRGPMFCWHYSTRQDSSHLCSPISRSWVSLSGRMEKVLWSWFQCRFSSLQSLLTLTEIQDNSSSISLFSPLNMGIFLTPLFSAASTHALIFPSTLGKNCRYQHT